MRKKGDLRPVPVRATAGVLSPYLRMVPSCTTGAISDYVQDILAWSKDLGCKG